MALCVKNWQRFQHYHNDNPAWLKLYRELLDDPEYHSMDPLAAKYLPLLWLACAPTLGELPPIDKLAFRLRISKDQLAALIPLWEPYLDGDSREYLEKVYGEPRETSRQRRGDERREEEIRGEEKRKGRFAPPSLSEVQEAAREKGYHFDPEAFHAFYESKGWKVGGAPMKDWRAAVRTWEKHAAERQQTQSEPDEHEGRYVN